MMNLVVPDNRVAVRSDLNAGECVPVYVVVFNQTPTFTENINAALMAVVYLISPDGRIRVGSDPDAGEIVRMYAVFNELTLTGLVHVNAARLAMVYLATNHCRIGTSYGAKRKIMQTTFMRSMKQVKDISTFNFEAGYAVVVDVVAFEIAKAIIERKDANVSTVMDMIPPHDWVGVVLHPDPG